MRSLLPDEFKFQNPGPDAFVTVAPKELAELQWLGGRGYRLYSIYIHGIKYVAGDGIVYNGTYIPVLWEDLADPIISGREELGYPKVFADLDILRTGTSYTLEGSWKATKFCTFELRGLENAENKPTKKIAPPEAGIDDGLLLYRYVPSVGQPGIADAEYPVFVPTAEEARGQATTTLRSFTAEPSEATFTWILAEPSALPTLHHIVARLAKIPVLEIVACGLMEKKGGGDLSSAKRIETRQPVSKL